MPVFLREHLATLRNSKRFLKLGTNLEMGKIRGAFGSSEMLLQQVQLELSLIEVPKTGKLHDAEDTGFQVALTMT